MHVTTAPRCATLPRAPPSLPLVWQLVPSTAIIAIKPRFVVVNRLGDPVQFFPTSARVLTEGQRVSQSGAPALLTDVVRPPEAAGAFRADPRNLVSGSSNLPDELIDLTDLPAAPPGAVTPIYGFNNYSASTSDLRIYLRVATQNGAWSVPLPLNEAATFHFFPETWRAPTVMASSSHDRSQDRWKLVRVSVHEQVPTVFVTIEDATASPPCCIRNDAHAAVWYSIWFSDKDPRREIWHELQPTAHWGKNDVGYHQMGVPVLWSNCDPPPASNPSAVRISRRAS